jgi:RNA polymerase sigma-70 factor, ECF subfamily
MSPETLTETPIETSIRTEIEEAEQIALVLRRGGANGADLAVLNRLVERYQARLVRYLVHLLGRREHVEDLVQETWLRVLERGRQYDSRLRFEPWLFAIARNLALDLLRRRSLPAGDASEIPASPDPSPFEATAKTEEAARLARSLAALEPLSREALLLRFQEEMSLLEIARVVQAPVSTVSSRIYRGLAALRMQLEKDENEQS